MEFCAYHINYKPLHFTLQESVNNNVVHIIRDLNICGGEGYEDRNIASKNALSLQNTDIKG